MSQFKRIFSILFLFICLSPIHAKTPSLSLREKIGQMLMFGFTGAEITAQSEIVKWIDQYHLGGVIAFDVDGQTRKLGKNIQTKDQVQKLTKSLQDFNRQFQKKHHRSPLPLLVAIDYEGGWVDRLKTAEGFEPTLSPALFPQLTPKKLKHELNKMAAYLSSAGFNLDFAPIVDVAVNPTNPIIANYKRSYSADPLEVIHFAELFVKALRTKNIQCAYKHFPGHGSSDKDSHLGLVDVSKTWKSYELMTYQKLLQDKTTCGFVMTAHLINRQLDPSGLPATLSHKMLTDLLRHHLRFKGVIISDDMQMKAIADQYTLKQAVTLAINAGVDMLLFSNQFENPLTPAQVVDVIETQVKSGAISAQRIDEAYTRIKAIKQGLL